MEGCGCGDIQGGSRMSQESSIQQDSLGSSSTHIGGGGVGEHSGAKFLHPLNSMEEGTC